MSKIVSVCPKCGRERTLNLRGERRCHPCQLIYWREYNAKKKEHFNEAGYRRILRKRSICVKHGLPIYHRSHFAYGRRVNPTVGCKICVAAEQTPELRRKYARRGYVRRRLRVITKLGGKCRICGIKDPLCLQIDHIRGDGWYERRILKFDMRKTMRWVLNSPLEKVNRRYQLLCANCNFKKRYTNLEASIGN